MAKDSKVRFMDGPLRRPAVIRMGFGYGSPMRVVAFQIDDIVGLEFPDTEKWASVIGHIEVADGQA